MDPYPYSIASSLPILMLEHLQRRDIGWVENEEIRFFIRVADKGALPTLLCLEIATFVTVRSKVCYDSMYYYCPARHHRN
jgi:hypothetical protein